ncbi:MAG: sporulation protein [Oscillospiraceae bacterium]|nr:sporulation protein [Oscillospiraceae bacterium]
MKNIKGLDIGIPLAGIGLFLLLPDAAAAGARAGLRLCAQLLIPALLPIAVLAGCLVRSWGGPAPGPVARLMEAVFGLGGACAPAFLLGQLGGFPLGAQLAARLYADGRVTRAEAEHAAAFCNNAGPAFLIGTAGLCLGSPAAGAALMGIQLLAALSAGRLLRGGPPPGLSNRPPREGGLSLSRALPQALGSSAEAMLRLTGAVVFFQALLACLETLLPLDALPPPARAGLRGALELSGGIGALRGAEGAFSFPLAAALVNWGGLCVHLQAAEALSSAGLSPKPYLLGKLVQACFGWVYGGLYLLLQRAAGPFSLPLLLLAPAGAGFFLFLKKRHWKTRRAVV